MLPTWAFNIHEVAYLKSNSEFTNQVDSVVPPKTLKAIALIWASCCRVPNFHPFPCFSWKPPLGRKMAKKICEGVEKGSVKADIFEKSSYWYAILFFPPLHCSFNRGADLIVTANKKKKKSEQRFAERFSKTGQQQVTCFFLLIYIIKRPEESQSGENYPP